MAASRVAGGYTTGVVQTGQGQDRHNAVNGSTAEACNDAKLNLDQARAMASDNSDPEGLKAAEQLLVPQVHAMNGALKTLMESQRGAGGEALKQMAQLGGQLRTFQQQVNAELLKLKAAKGKAETGVKQKEAEGKDMAAFADILPDATTKSNLAEDAVEKAVITAEMIAAAGDDMAEVKDAVTQTEQAVQAAQKAIGEARIFLNAKQASTHRFESEGARTKAGADLSKLQTAMQETQTKLNPLKTVRQDYLQRAAAQKVIAEILDKLTPAEVDVDRVGDKATLHNGKLRRTEKIKYSFS